MKCLLKKSPGLEFGSTTRGWTVAFREDLSLVSYGNHLSKKANQVNQRSHLASSSRHRENFSALLKIYLGDVRARGDLGKGQT